MDITINQNKNSISNFYLKLKLQKSNKININIIDNTKININTINEKIKYLNTENLLNEYYDIILKNNYESNKLEIEIITKTENNNINNTRNNIATPQKLDLYKKDDIIEI